MTVLIVLCVLLAVTALALAVLLVQAREDVQEARTELVVRRYSHEVTQ